MHCVREKKEASICWTREQAKGYFSRTRDGERARHVGNRGKYNGKHLGTNYTGGKRNSSVSFMFFNFPDG